MKFKSSKEDPKIKVQSVHDARLQKQRVRPNLRKKTHSNPAQFSKRSTKAEKTGRKISSQGIS